MDRHSEIMQQIYESWKDKYKLFCARHRGGHDNPPCAKYGEEIPLFTRKERSRKSRIAEVDMIALSRGNGKVKYIIEVETSFPPKTIIGDIIACQLSKFCKHGSIEGSELLIVVDSQGLDTEKSSKREQFEEIKERMNEILTESSLKDYHLIYSDSDEFREWFGD